MTIESKSDPKEVELEGLIYRRIRETGADIHVHVTEGRISLSGIANDFETKRNIMAVVQEIGGVNEVTNNIRVAPFAD